MKFLKSLLAWIAKTPIEEKTMTDTYDANGQLIQPAPELTADALAASLLNAQPATVELPAVAEPVIQTEAAPMIGVVSESIFEKLKTILGALGHELPVFFDEAVALAKKAL